MVASRSSKPHQTLPLVVSSFKMPGHKSPEESISTSLLARSHSVLRQGLLHIPAEPNALAAFPMKLQPFLPIDVIGAPS